jgi:hypothetical protein
MPPLKGCVTIKFTRDPSRAAIATFTYSGADETVQTQSNPFFNQVLSLTMPNGMTGVSVVTAGFIEFFFKENTLPHLVIKKSDGTIVSDVRVHCIKVSYNESVLRPIVDGSNNPPGSQQNPDFVIHP